MICSTTSEISWLFNENSAKGVTGQREEVWESYLPGILADKPKRRGRGMPRTRTLIA